MEASIIVYKQLLFKEQVESSNLILFPNGVT